MLKLLCCTLPIPVSIPEFVPVPLTVPVLVSIGASVALLSIPVPVPVPVSLLLNKLINIDTCNRIKIDYIFVIVLKLVTFYRK